MKKTENGKGREVLDLATIARELAVTFDLDSLLRKLGAATEQLLEAGASSILLVDDDRKHLYFKVATGAKGVSIKRLRVPIGKGFAGWTAQEEKPLLVNEPHKDPRFSEEFEKAAGFEMKSVLCVPMILHGELVGVVEVLNKNGGPFSVEDQTLLEQLSELAAAAVANARLQEKHRNFFANAIEIFIAALEAKFPQIKGHSVRMAQAACSLARSLEMGEDEYKDLYYAALLHDIGLIQCQDPQDPKHPGLGAELLKNVILLRGVVPIIRHHHEHWDGSGFPDGLQGESIPLGSRILELLEAVEEWKAKPGVTGTGFTHWLEQEISKSSGSRFDPSVVKAFLEHHLFESQHT